MSTSGAREPGALKAISRRLIALERRVAQRLTTEVCRRIYRDPGPEAMSTAMVVGTGRSGTTWIAEIIDSQIPCRLIFEPFNPDQVRAFSRFEFFQYMRPDQENAELLSFCRAIVRGELRGRWVDGYLARMFPRLRLIKDIRPTLMLRWFHDRFPDVPLLYVLRHPCAVVLSRMRLGWATDVDIERFLRQPQLVADHVQPYLDIIGRAQTAEEKHAIVWCLSNAIPLRQFAHGGWTLLYYERMRRHPEAEIPRLFEALDVAVDQRVFSKLRRPSRTTRSTSGRVHGGDDDAAWKSDLSPAQIDRVLAIVDAFGLGHIYGDSAVPLVSAPEATRTTRTGGSLSSVAV